MLFWRRRHEIRDEELSAYVDGELSSAALERVGGHLESCIACRETVAELRAVHEAVSGLPHVRAPRSFALREADVLAQPRSGASGLFSSATPLLSGVAAIAIVAFVVLAGVDVASDGGGAGDFAGAALEESAALSMDTERGMEVLDADSAAPPGVSEFGDAYSGGDGEDETQGRAFNYGSGEGSISIDDANDNQTDISSGPQTALAEDTRDTSLRIAEGVAAAVAISAGGAALFIWWRRRQSSAT